MKKTTTTDLPRPVVGAYTERLRAHIEAVQEFGRRLGLPESQLEQHDRSKWSPAEFTPYARYFVQHEGSPVDRRRVAPSLARAWLHHIHHNPHHWQHWIFPDGWTPAWAGMENGVLEMPTHYALEMIADWHGASYTYTGSWDIADWLYKSMPGITLHSATAEYVRGQLDALGYADVVYGQQWAHEVES